MKSRILGGVDSGVVRDAAKRVHEDLLELNGEPLDGDETEVAANIFLDELDILNGNK